jgi:hypothetical protein
MFKAIGISANKRPFVKVAVFPELGTRRPLGPETKYLNQDPLTRNRVMSRPSLVG